MRNRPLPWLLIVLVLALLALAGLLLWGFPRVIMMTPADGAVDVPPGAPLRITFSRPLDPDADLLHISPAVPGEARWDGDVLVFTPEDGWPAGETITVTVTSGTIAATFPLLPLRQGATFAFTVSQPGLLYLFPTSGPANIYLYDLAADRHRPVTDLPAGVLAYDVLQTAGAVYFNAPLPSGGSVIYRLELNPLIHAESPAVVPAEEAVETGVPPDAAAEPLPAPEKVLTCTHTCQSLALAPAGDYLAYEQSGGGEQPRPQVWMVALDPLTGGTVGQPVLVGHPDHQTLQPLWSPTGRLAIYDDDTAEILLLDPSGDQMVRFSNQTGQLGAWRPDGQAFAAAEILFLSSSGTLAQAGLEKLADSHLFQYPWDGGHPLDLTGGEGIEDTAPAFSPDGTRMAFARKYLDTRRWTPGRQLWLLDFNTRQAAPLTADPLYNHFDFTWSPGGDRIAFSRFDQSTLSQPPEVWLVHLATGQLQQVIVGGYAPRWIP